MKRMFIAGALALAAASLAACAVSPTTGDYTIFGQDVGAKDSAAIADAQKDIQNFIKSLPNACAQAAQGQAFTTSQLSVAQQVMKTPPKTVANLNNIASDIVAVCNGAVLATAPLLSQ